MRSPISYCGNRIRCINIEVGKFVGSCCTYFFLRTGLCSKINNHPSNIFEDAVPTMKANATIKDDKDRNKDYQNKRARELSGCSKFTCEDE